MRFTNQHEEDMARAIRTCPKIRRIHILNAAIEASVLLGYQGFTRESVAKLAKISSPLIAHYFPKMADLRRAVMKYAIDIKCFTVIAQGLVSRHPLALKISDDLREEVMQHLSPG
jgi:AcrR family transcriptional regulator